MKMPNLWNATNCLKMQGVLSRTNVFESCRFMKIHVQIYVPKRPKIYLCPKKKVRKTSTKYVEIINSRYFHKHVDYI